jgi:hypothetical protein
MNVVRIYETSSDESSDDRRDFNDICENCEYCSKEVRAECMYNLDMDMCITCHENCKTEELELLKNEHEKFLKVICEILEKRKK